MVSVTSDRIRAALLTTVILGAGALSLVGLYLARQSLGGHSLDVTLLGALLPFAIWSFGLRTLRWHTLVRSIIPDVSPILSSFVQIVGFAFSVTPGRVAEVYKLKLLERGTGVPVAQMLPAMVIERLTEAIALGLLVVVGELLRWSPTANVGSTLPLVAIGCILLILALVCAPSLSRWERARVRGVTPPPFWRGLQNRSENVLGRIPVARRLLPFLASDRVSTLLRQARTGGTQVTRPGTLGLALALVILGRLGDGVVLWKISQAVGYPMSYATALVLVGTTGLVGGISLSPGGIGTAEAALVGLVVAQGMPLGAAVVAALTTRVLLFWVWVVLGLSVFAVTHGYAFVKDSAALRIGGAWRLGAPAKRTVERGG